jgi:hypothetical protein
MTALRSLEEHYAALDFADYFAALILAEMFELHNPTIRFGG